MGHDTWEPKSSKVRSLRSEGKRSADRLGRASCAKGSGDITTCAADRRPAWLIPGRVAVLFPLTPPLPPKQAVPL